MRRGAVLAAMISALAAPAAADDLTERLRVCRGLAAVTERVACYDRIVDEQTPRSAPVQATPAASAPAPVPATTALASRFGAEQIPAPRSAKAEPETAKSIEASVTGLQLGADSKALITLDNGQVWAQVEAERLMLKLGDRVTVKRGMLGSYILVPAGLHRSYRVTRVQ
jgi:hypothetical protein